MKEEDIFRKQALKYHWEDRYDALQEKIYLLGWCWKNWRKDKGGKHPKKIIREYISQELQSCKEQIIKEIIKKIEEATKDFKTSRFTDLKKIIYVDDVLSIIKELK